MALLVRRGMETYAAQGVASPPHAPAAAAKPTTPPAVEKHAAAAEADTGSQN